MRFVFQSHTFDKSFKAKISSVFARQTLSVLLLSTHADEKIAATKLIVTKKKKKQKIGFLKREGT